MTPKIIRSKLLTGVAKRISLLFLLAAMLPTAVLFWLTYDTVREVSAERAQHRLAERNHAYAMVILERLTLAENMLNRIDMSHENHRGHLDSLHPFPFRGITRSSVNGRILDHAGQPNDPPRLTPFLNSMLLQNQKISKAALHVLPSSSPNKIPDILMAVTRTNHGGSESILLGVFDPRYLWGDPDFVPHDINICVYADKNVRLYCSMPHADDVSPQPGTELAATWQLFLNGPFNAENWLFTTRPAYPAASELGRFLENFTIVGFLSVLLVSLLSLIHIRRTMGPLTSLILGTRKIAGGNFENIGVTGNDEFRELANAFNDMSSRISRQISTLHALSAIDREIQEKLDTFSVFQQISERVHAMLPDSLICKVLIDEAEQHAMCCIKPFAAPCAQARLDLHMDAFHRIQSYTNGIWLDSHPLGTVESERLMQQHGPFSWWAIPLTWQGTMLGFLVVGCKSPEQASSEMLDEIRELASRMAVAISSDKRERQLQYQARYDSLTGLPNRITLFEMLNAILVEHRNQPIAALFIDIDRFKFINDTLGHRAGDAFLKMFAARLQAAAGGEDIVARLGGDEFVVILRNRGLKDDIIREVESIAQTLAAPYMLDGREYVLTCSIGVALHAFNDTGTELFAATAEEIVESADLAMYRTKTRGRNNYQFYTYEMLQHSRERLRLDADVRKALDNNEFKLEYQPQVDLRTGMIIGTEALIRWEHPELGMTPPLRFIGLLEEIGQIVPVGDWVIRTACAQAKKWQQAGLGKLRMAINISAAQFSHQKFADTIAFILDEFELAPACLELELTESILMANADHALDTMHRLRSLGFNLSIDDFGTGYSSLSYLRQFPVNILKIDRSFVSNLARNTDELAIVQSIIALAHRLRMQVVAEGVETLEHLACLQESGCDAVQGYLFSKPVSPEDMTRILLERRSLHQLNTISNAAPAC